jgi:hypothetical protein
MTRLVTALTVVALSACAARGTPSRTPAPLGAELWAEPTGARDLFHGVGGAELAPPAKPHFKLERRDPSGFSVTLDLTDDSGREWSAKLGPEAQPEVVVSRLLWAVGYHQPPAYYVNEFTVNEGGADRAHQVARLRPKPDWLDAKGTWSWLENPFVGTRPYRGLLVLLMIVNSTDLKDSNNTIYHVRRGQGPPKQWFVVKDLGASLGETGGFYPDRNSVDEFEKRNLIRAVSGGRVEFDYSGRHKELLTDITVEDVVWMCRRLSRLSDRQWDDAFRAAAYPEVIRRRYIEKIKSKIREGLALEARASK